ncbi:MAG: glycerophosphodiester phosphodiesterase family protein [Methylococcales bacterium]
MVIFDINISPLLNIAHRGARAYAPENTLAAFAKAKQFGCQMLELDVRMSKDGVVVVYHDEHLQRCTDVAKQFPDRAEAKLAEFTYAELLCLDAGSWYVAELSSPSADRQDYLQSLSDQEIAQFVSPEELGFYGSGQVKIPTLQQTLEFAETKQILINIELKELAEFADSVAMTTAVVALVEAMHMSGQVLISSFAHPLLSEVRKLSADIATAVLCDQPIEQVVDYLQNLAVRAYNLGCGSDTQVNPTVSLQIQQLRALHYDVNAWTCNNPEQMRRLIAAGVSGIISDYPNRVSDVLDRVE